MEVKISSTYVGPNLYAEGPAVLFTIGSPPTFTAEQLAAFTDSLALVLPGFSQHSCALGAPACWIAQSPACENGEVELSHLFEHLCVALQNLAGAEVQCIRTNTGADLSKSQAVVACEVAEVSQEAARLVASWFTGFFSGDTQSAYGDSDAGERQSDASLGVSNGAPFSQQALAADIEQFQAFSERHTLPVQDRALVRAAHQRSVPVIRLVGRLLQLGQGARQHRLSATKTTHTNVVSNDIAANKDYSRRLLEQLGLPSPRYERVYRGRAAVAAAERIGYPVVVKPNFGNTGRGVSVGMQNAKQVRAAYKSARKYGRSVLVEEIIDGADFRMLVIGSELCAASRRMPAHVVGDGEQSIEQLVAAINSDPRRGIGARFSWTRIALDERSDQVLATQKYSRDSIPEKGEVVYLRRNANTSDGGTAVDVTDEVHPDNREIAVMATLAMGLDIAGVDILTTDISRSMRETGGAICEVNSRPGLRKHMWPAQGKPRDVTGPIVDMLYPPGTASRIPIIAITGDGDRVAVARWLAHILAQRFQHVGLVTQGCAWVNGQQLMRSDALDATLPAATQALLMHPRLEAMVIDADPGEIERYGLGHDLCDTCVVVSADVAQPVAPDLANSIAVVARCAREHIVLGSALAGDYGHAHCHRMYHGGNSTPGQPSLNFKRNAGGMVVSVSLGRDKSVALEPSKLVQLAAAEHGAPFACAAALLSGIEPAVITGSLDNFGRSAWRDNA